WLYPLNARLFTVFPSAASSPNTLSRRNQNTIRDLPFLVFVFTTLLVSPFLTQTGQFIVEQATMFEGANFAFCTCSKARFQI
ncbi:hypothetical protein K443DRAFT_98826, partial [Laccaria amethystina LaAM-08-1]